MKNQAQNRVHALVEAKRSVLEALCRKHGVRRLALFGSAVTDDFDPAHSDLDFIVKWEPTDPSEHGSHWFGQVFDLEDLFGRQSVLPRVDGTKAGDPI